MKLLVGDVMSVTFNLKAKASLAVRQVVQLQTFEMHFEFPHAPPTYKQEQPPKQGALVAGTSKPSINNTRRPESFGYRLTCVAFRIQLFATLLVREKRCRARRVGVGADLVRTAVLKWDRSDRCALLGSRGCLS